MRIAVLQMDIVYEDKAANRRTVSKYAAEARAAGADLLVLPEMFDTGFSMNPARTAEPLDGETPEFLRRCAREHGMAVIGGFTLRDGEKSRNVALTVNAEGEDSALYAKTHLFSFMNEDKHHAAGDGPRPFELEGVRGACFICYDLRFPELFRQLGDRCQVVFVIASWPETRRAHWDILLRARAVENQLYIVAANRVGQGGGLSFTGGSVVIDPLGVLVAQRSDDEGLVIADIDPGKVTEVRSALPFLNDRRF